MPTSFVLGQPPFIQATNLIGRWLPYGKLITKDWDTREDKATYEDPDGTVENSNPVLTDDIGRFPMIWFATDSPYYLEIRDADDNLIFQTPEPYIPGIGSGSILDEALDSPNLFINGQFSDWPIQSYSPVPDEISYLADGGWRWAKNGTNTSDTLQFVAFSLDNNSLSPPAKYYLNYTSTLAGTGETEKDLFVIFPSVRTLCGEEVTISFQAQSAIAGTFQLVIGVVQNFGDGGTPSPDVDTLFGSVTLTQSWQEYTVTGTIPTLEGKTLGSSGTDYLEVFIVYPLNTAQNINIDNLYLKRGSAVTGYPYLTETQNKSAIYGYNGQWSTGDVKTSFKLTADPGWLYMNDGSIGSPASSATARANIDTFALYKLLWNGVSSPTANAYCTVNGGLGASASADFLAHKRMNLPAILGRSLIGVGSSLALSLGQNSGASTATLSVGNMPTGMTFNSVVTDPSHFHTVEGSGPEGTPGGMNLDSDNEIPGPVNTDSKTTGITVATTGPIGAANTPLSIVQPVLAIHYMIKL